MRQRLGGGTGKVQQISGCKCYFVMSKVIVLKLSISPLRFSSKRCQREAGAERCSFQNPWQGRSRSGARCTSDDQLTQAGTESVHRLCTNHTKDSSNTTFTEPDACAADTDTHQQQSCWCQYKAVWF